MELKIRGNFQPSGKQEIEAVVSLLSGWTGVEATAKWIKNADIPSALCCPIYTYAHAITLTKPC